MPLTSSQQCDLHVESPKVYGESVFLHDNPDESDRLSLIEEEQDPYSTAVIETLGISPDWHCLEIGAGKGSMAIWLADRCPEGKVLALDLDISLIELRGRSNIEARQIDIEKEPLPAASFDLIHARGILTHMANPQELCNRLAHCLRPGGWLFVADPASFPVDSSHHPLMRKVGQVSTIVMSQMIGTDPNWARRYPLPLLNAGLSEVGAECRLQLMQGGSREARMFELMLRQIEHPMMQTGLIEAREINEIRQVLLDPSFYDFPPAFVRAWGRRVDF